MTPQEHYEKAENYAHDAWFADAETAPVRAALAQAHATLALAGFMRDTGAVVEATAHPQRTIDGDPESGRTLLDYKQAAAHARCSPSTIRRRIADGSLTAYRFGPRMVRIDAADLDAVLRSRP